MKKLLLCVLTFTLLTGCQDNNQTSVDSKMSVFKKNTETTKAWLDAFMQNDSTAFFSDKYMMKYHQYQLLAQFLLLRYLTDLLQILII